MSTPEDKLKHSKRRFADAVQTAEQMDIAKAHGLEIKQPHRYSKRKVMNCGNPRCFSCSNPRLFGELTMQEKRQREIYF